MFVPREKTEVSEPPGEGVSEGDKGEGDAAAAEAEEEARLRRERMREEQRRQREKVSPNTVCVEKQAMHRGGWTQ